MKRSTYFWLSPFVAFFGLAVWMGALHVAGDPRVADNSLSGGEMLWFESVVFVYALCGLIVAWLFSIGSALSANRYGWAAAIFFFWPIAIVFIWREGKEPIQPPQTTPVSAPR